MEVTEILKFITSSFYSLHTQLTEALSIRILKNKISDDSRLTKHTLIINDTTNLNIKLFLLPQLKPSVLQCIMMWCTLRIAIKSTRHSAVSLASDITHCPPPADRSVYNPSTALAAPQIVSLPGKGYCCHVGLFKAKFSKNENNAKGKLPKTVR